MNPASSETVATLRVELEGIQPLIWRRFAVRTATTLDKLHRVIQAAMGWQDRHLWMLTAGDCNFSIVIHGDDDWNKRVTNAKAITLTTIMSSNLKTLGYCYDFGDNWEHRVFVESTKPALSQSVCPRFLGGERRCPPEDCGGIPGYYDFLNRLSGRSARERKAALDWYGGPYDPDDIDEQQIKASFEQLAQSLAENR